ncbi:hypothetical protein BGZ83_007542 [Gryganskiella cystojenkinii]|nr:hypothetical protein BGZ83_007542 [Gryganskiella cystojenkinii]
MRDRTPLDETVLSIPHLIASISHELRDHDLAQCALVNKSWCKVFEFELYHHRTVDDQRLTDERRRNSYYSSSSSRRAIKNNPSRKHHSDEGPPDTRVDLSYPLPGRDMGGNPYHWIVTTLVTDNSSHPSYPLLPEPFHTVLSRNRHLIQSIRSGTSDFFRLLNTLSISSLKELSTLYADIDPDLVALIDRNKSTLQRLQMGHYLPEDSITGVSPTTFFWTGIAKLTALTSLQVSLQGKDLQVENWLTLALTSIPQTLIDLDLSVNGYYIYDEEEYISTSTLLPASLASRDHSALKSIKFTVHVQRLTYTSKLLLAKFSTQCRQLCYFSCDIQEETGFSLEPPDDVLFMMGHALVSEGIKVLSSLEHFAVRLGFCPPEGFVHYFESLEPGPLTSLTVAEVYMVDDAETFMAALEPHLPFLESITFQRTIFLTRDIAPILVRCPRLKEICIHPDLWGWQHWDQSEEWYDDYQWRRDFSTSVDFTLSVLWQQPWACLRSLTHVTFLIDWSTSYEGPTKWSKLYPRALPAALHIYDHLSHLINLESLQVGCLHEKKYQHYVDRGHQVGFDFSLASGLPILGSLTRLKRIAFFERLCHFPEGLRGNRNGPFEPQIRQWEIAWMLEHWPNLEEIQVDIKDALELQSKHAKICADAEHWRLKVQDTTIAMEVLSKLQSGIRAVAWSTTDELRSGMMKKVSNGNNKANDTSSAGQEEFNETYSMARTLVEQSASLLAIEMGDEFVGPLNDWELVREQFKGRAKVWFWPGEGDIARHD